MLKKLEDIPVNSAEVLEGLAELFKEKVPESKPQQVREFQPGFSSGSGGSGSGSQDSLGQLDIGKYLSNFGVSYDLKTEGNKNIFRLHRCLFNSEHGRGDAAVIQDSSGKITYHCYHNSCREYTWRDARQIISGQESLAKFCENYNPDFKPEKKKKRKKQNPGQPEVSPFDTGKKDLQEWSEDNIPAPDKIDPNYFFDGRSFMPQFLAKYLEAYLAPIKNDGACFYKYEKTGVWKPFYYEHIAHLSEKTLDKQAKPTRIRDAASLLSNRVYVDPEDFKHNTDFINTKSGMIPINSIDVDHIDVLNHHPDYNSKIQLDIEYKPGKVAHKWHEFLDSVFPGKNGIEKQYCLQSFMGYCLLPDCRFQRCLFMIGSGSNGKSVISDVLINIVGEENVSSLPLQHMNQRFLVGQLRDKLVNIAGEISTNAPIDTELFKDAVAGGLVMADQKHGKEFKFYSIAKHIFAMNETPKITDKSYGFQRRPIVLKFTERFEGRQKDPLLTQKLLEERDEIFNWMLEGLQMILVNGCLYVPDEVKQDGASFMKNVNPVLVFVDDSCILGDGFSVSPPKLYESYLEWCHEGRNRPLSRNNFYSQIEMHFPKVRKAQVGEKRQRVYQGIGLNALGGA